MGVGEDFQKFCSNLAISPEKRGSISSRYKKITKRLNQDFRSSDSSTQNSFYAGSYGRSTAINGFSDLDMIFVMPFDCYERYGQYKGNGQSALLQDIRRWGSSTGPLKGRKHQNSLKSE
jgi:tRNA nucleotidyltransferase (CCA-adding enzyme)